MKLYLVWLPVILILSVLQAAFLPLNLVLLLVLLLSLQAKSFWLAFWAGLLFDLASGLVLGTSSLIFLVACFGFRWFTQRFDIRQPLLPAGFVLAAVLLYQRLVFGSWSWWPALVLAVLVFLLQPLISYFQENQGGLKLRY